MKLYINSNPSVFEATRVSKTLREDEVVPLEELGASPADSCLAGIQNSEYVFTINTEYDEPIALVGLVDHEDQKDTGIIWSLSTNRVAKYPFAFVKALRELIEEYGGLYSRLISFALADNFRHQRFHNVIGMTPTGEYVEIPDTLLTYRVYELMTTKGLNGMYYDKN
mgnify:CR=1 FL=1